MSAAKRMRTEIRPCTRKDLAKVAEIHKSRFLVPSALLGQLSEPLIAALYAAFLDRSTFLVHLSGGEVDGFVLGGSSRAMLRCRLSFVCRHPLACVAEVVCRPKLWRLALRSFVALIGKWFASMSGTPSNEEFRMLSIAVAAHAARKGVGTELVESFEAAIRATCRAYCLNVLKSNRSALKFYEKLAFQLAGETAIAWTLRKDLAANR